MVHCPPQLTTTMTRNEAITDQPQTCRLPHISISLNNQGFQSCGKK